MAESKITVKLDQKLMESGVLDTEFKNDYKKVHLRLNSHVRKTGKILTEKTFKKGDEHLRTWLTELYRKGASQEKLTSYLRCGLAHLCCDFIESTYKIISLDELITRTIQSLKKRNYHKSYFKVAASKLNNASVKKTVKKKPAVKKSEKKKPEAVKKTTAKKAAIKKVAAKKPAAAKNAAKKTSSSKASPKKAVSKKTAPKKAATKKGTPQKPAAKKASSARASSRTVASKKTPSNKAASKKVTAKKPAAKKAAPKKVSLKMPALKKKTSSKKAGAKELVNNLLDKARKIR